MHARAHAGRPSIADDLFLGYIAKEERLRQAGLAARQTRCEGE